jgi:hypothetical protein
MPGKKQNTYRESEYAKDLVKIMQASNGPFTRAMLAEELGKLHPDLYWQTLMREISGAMLMDKLSKAGRFKVVKKGWYGLAGREYPNV